MTPIGLRAALVVAVATIVGLAAVLIARPTVPAAAGDDRASYGAGTWLIGQDMPAGRYTTTVPADGPGCSWARLSKDDDAIRSIIQDRVLDPGAHGSLTTTDGEYLRLTGPCDWKLT